MKPKIDFKFLCHCRRQKLIFNKTSDTDPDNNVNIEDFLLIFIDNNIKNKQKCKQS